MSSLIFHAAVIDLEAPRDGRPRIHVASPFWQAFIQPNYQVYALTHKCWCKLRQFLTSEELHNLQEHHLFKIFKKKEEEDENANRSVLLLSLSFNSKIFTPNMRTEPHPIPRRLLAYSGCRRSKRTCTFKNRNGNKDDQSSSVISAGLLLSCAYLLYSMFASVKACMTQCTLVCICVYASGKGGRADDFESRCSAPNGAQHKKPSAKPE